MRGLLVRAVGAARALYFSAVAGASIVRRAKPGDGRAANHFLGRSALHDCWNALRASPKAAQKFCVQ